MPNLHTRSIHRADPGGRRLDMDTHRSRRAHENSRTSTLLTIGLAALLAVGCARIPEADDSLTLRDEAQLGGEALQQRKHDLNRAYRDMVHFQTTMQSLIDRHDSRSLASFDRFVEAYMGTHLEPLLASRWQSSHPELMARDASVRFMQAELLLQMRYPRRVQEVRDEIATRYQGQYDLLIEYPVGKQGTLGRGLEILKDRKWRG